MVKNILIVDDNLDDLQEMKKILEKEKYIVKLQKLKVLILTGNNYSQQDLDNIKSKLPPTTIIATE